MSKKLQILNTALNMMARKGSGDTSLQEIANAVGIRKPSIMYHFESKEALRHAVLNHVFQHWNDVLPRLLQAHARDGLSRFELLTSELSRLFSEDPNRARFILRELLDRPREVRALVESHVKPWTQIIASELDKAVHDGMIDASVDAQAFVWSMVTSVIANVALHSPSRAQASGLEPEFYHQEVIRMARARLFGNPKPPLLESD